ncbi:MAG: DNA gyrase subunit A [Bordetella sp.]|nr:MAG: DNA gyrase subunit A [Bordetella sp.]
MNSFAKEMLPIMLEEEMQRSYLDYAMSVIIGRALPDVRDGLKPVHRRILFAMHELNNDWNRSYKKSARIVGDVIGKYHPHGDQSVYDTIVRMAQTFSMRSILIDGQGNFGSIDGDNAAAMRYTEIRLTKIAHELLSDLDQETVDFRKNYDNTEEEPVLLPARFPNLLINGSSGIAVGMATSIPPHNSEEVINACLYCLKNINCSIDELINIIPAPDFPTGGIIYGTTGIKEGYKTGRGRVVLRAKTHIENIESGKYQMIVVDDLPYQVNKKILQERIAELVNSKKIEGISEIRDESDKDGIRLVIQLKRGEIPDIVLNNLYKYTQLQDTFGINLVALVGNQPKLLNLKEMVLYFLQHRREIITRRSIFQLKKFKERLHILEGLSVALSNIDDFIVTIKTSSTPAVAKKELLMNSWNSLLVREALETHNHHSNENDNSILTTESGIQKNGLYRLSDLQVNEIMNMRLQRLTNLERDKIIEEFKNTISKIENLTDILSKPERINNILHEELLSIKSEFSHNPENSRRSDIVVNTTEIEIGDLITPTDMVVTLSHDGYIKSQILSEYSAQKRGGRGKKATSMKENDSVDQLFISNTHDFLLCFSNHGRVYRLRVWEVPQSSRGSRGYPIINMFPLESHEKITTILPITRFSKTQYIFMATYRGVVKKTPLSDFENFRKSGIIAIGLNKEDYLIGVELTDGKCNVMLFSNAGRAVRFNENDVRSMGRSAQGVRGMTLKKDQGVISLLVARDEKYSVLTVSQNGFGKRTPITEYTRHKRGTKGMIAMRTGIRNGNLVSAILVMPEDDIVLVTTSGLLIRTRISEIREMGRATHGVTLVNLVKGSFLSSVRRVVRNDSESVVNNILSY